MSDDELRGEMRRTVADFLKAESGPQARRTAMASEYGYDRTVFERAMTELGLGGLVVVERLGGLGLGFAEAAVVIEELGREVVPSPLPDTLVGATVLAELDGGEPAQTLLRRLAVEPVSIALCGLTPTPDDAPVTTDGSRLSGRYSTVPFGASADLLLVIAGEGDRATVHLVSPEQAGVVRTQRWALDHTRRLADIDLTDAHAERVSDVDDRGAAAARLRDLSRVALAAESAAAAQACLDGTVGYLKVREQFGRAIGSFQALKHRCADLAVAVGGARATAQHAVEFAARAQRVDELGDDLPTVAALAKTVCSDTLMRVAADCLQLYGGVGFTFEHDLHLYLKRAKANQLLEGSPPRLREQLTRRVLSD